MSTPTPMNRPRPALKPTGSQRPILSGPKPRPSSQAKKDVTAVSPNKPAKVSLSQPQLSSASFNTYIAALEIS